LNGIDRDRSDNEQRHNEVTFGWGEGNGRGGDLIIDRGEILARIGTVIARGEVA
jgi:hypothetical protein